MKADYNDIQELIELAHSLPAKNPILEEHRIFLELKAIQQQNPTQYTIQENAVLEASN